MDDNKACFVFCFLHVEKDYPHSCDGLGENLNEGLYITKIRVFISMFLLIEMTKL